MRTKGSGWVGRGVVFVWFRVSAEEVLSSKMSPMQQDEEVGGEGGIEEVNREEADRRLLSKELENSVAAHPEDASLRFQLGVSLWENSGDSSESKEKAAEHFVVSAKYNPGHGPTFRYLGHYYCRVSLDSQRALKCYRRALAIDPDDSESGEALCDMLDSSGNETLELAVCKEACEKSPRAFWAFRRRGYLHLDQKRWSEAVQCLQHAIRGYPASADLWEALGLAYQRLGMFTAATKSYGRAIELEDTRVFALVESGNVFLMLGSFRKGIELFHQALQISPKNISANYGLASGLLGLSKECMSLGALRWGASLLEVVRISSCVFVSDISAIRKGTFSQLFFQYGQDASKIAGASAQLAGNISCIWKLHGDIQLTYARCFPWVEDDKMIQSDAKAFNGSLVSWKQTCLLAAFSSRRSYLKAVHLAPWQASIYADTAIASDMISSMEDEDSSHDLYSWQLQEKMALGALLLEGDNYEFWVTLGCLSRHTALKQHALIRGLQLDVSLASAWAYLGKIYREEGEKKLARQAFDFSRSIDPSLALPWAGMSADCLKGLKSDEEFESCLRAVNILPLAEFQIGLCYLALLSGNLASSQVYAAIMQAVQRSPQSAEAHNLNGLACEARFEYESAVASYRISRCVMHNSSCKSSKSHFRDITINLARSLVKAGCALDAVHECEYLDKEGMLDTEGMQIYAYALWKLGDNNHALVVARALAAAVSTVGKISTSAIVSFISRLLYCISGIDLAITYLLKMPNEAFDSTSVSLVVRAIHALDQSTRLQSTVSNRCYLLFSGAEAVEMNYLMALSDLVKHGSGVHLAYGCGITQLRRALHLYPNSILIRNLLGHLLLSKEWKDTHVANRCCIIRAPFGPRKDGLRSGYDILGAATVSCYSSGSQDQKLSFPACNCMCQETPRTIHELQKYVILV
ncbi:unnamed protein product [Linum tenue]|uniref:Tetratricopeptide repeat protein SKI3 n=1 Tax=Linum tenue TaxID=586396 RepID=A0AAV0NY44_9ROSI|nr:unnamed protein product [Linum tenue]